MTADFSVYEREQLARIESTPSAPESFDPIAAIRRVEELCDVADDQPDGYECRFIATDLIRAALAADSAPTQGAGL